ncbi:MAG: ABC transporter substrate-binding protein [Candidatus Marinimicrobia bacterium]|nr:ABC transporter substrate-binding protein [Candidatus Neomarinimicrobiota bacterium]
MKKILLFLTILLPLFGQNWFQSRLIEKQIDMAIEHFNQDRFAIAETIINKLIEKPLGIYEPKSRIMLMKTAYALNKKEDVKIIGRDFLEKFPNNEFAKDVYLKFGDTFIDEQNFNSAFRMYIQARTLSTNEEFLNLVDQRILNTIQLNILPTTISELSTISTNINQRIIYVLAKAFNDISSGNPDECALFLYQLNPEEIPVNYFDLYEKLLRASYQPPVKTITVGVIIPLSGDNVIQGNSFLRGMHKALSVSMNSNKKIAFIIKDNNGNEIQTIRAVKELEKNPDVKAIIGPIAESNAIIAANSLQGKNIPLLIPSASLDEITSLGNNIYQLNSNLSTRGKIAAKYITKILELDSIAILAPADNFGRALTDAFIKEVDQLGKKVVGVEWYSGIPIDLKRQFKNLRKIAFDLKQEDNNYDEYLGMALDSLDFLFELSDDDLFDIPDDEDEKLTASDSSKIKLNTIQAIYSPTHPEHLAYIGTQFPMYYFDTQIVGNDSWKNLDILNQSNIGPHMEGLSIISSNYSIDIKDQIYSQAFDCTQLIYSIIDDQDNGRLALAKRLSNLSDFNGQSHNIQFSESNLNTSLQVLRYEDNQIIRTGYFVGDSLLSLEGIAP